MGPRAKVLLNGAVTVVALALIIVGLWAFTSPRKSPDTPAAAPPNSAQLSVQAYSEGAKALSAEQTGTAIALLEKALKLDPANTDAKKALESAKKSASSAYPAPESSGEEPQNVVAPAGVWTTKLALRSLLPTAFPAFSLGSVEQGGPTEANVSATPDHAGSPVSGILWTVHDSATSSKANAFVSAVSKKLYTRNVAQVSVNGVSAYFGTDGGRLATVAYVRGRYVFEVVVTAEKPASAKDLATRAAAAFSTNP